MTGYSRGDVILVGFIFSDESDEKRRPALILSSDSYHKSRQEVIMAAITSNTGRLLAGDQQMKNWQTAGLLFPSVVTGIIRTIKPRMIVKKLGAISRNDMLAVEEKLKDILELNH